MPLRIRQTLFEAKDSSIRDVVTQNSRNGHVVWDVNVSPRSDSLGIRHINPSVLRLVAIPLTQ
jgi:hypothetical protein